VVGQSNDDWVKVETIFGAYSSKDELACKVFERVELAFRFKDGFGHEFAMPTLTIPCLAGAKGNFRSVDVSASRPRLYPVPKWGWPLATVGVKAVQNNLPDKKTDPLRFRLNPF
jgi:hypothetical protein